MVKKLSQLHLELRKALLTAENPQIADQYARSLLCHVTGKNHAQLLADREMYVSDSVCEAADACLQRLLAGEPLAYVLGEWEFYGLPITVNPNVLIPRDDTCAVVDLAIRHALFLNEKPRILDLCTGSGCIGLAISSRVPDARVTLADISPEALAVAKTNVTRNHLSGNVTCVRADALKKPAAFLGKFDMIVSNPPYITSEEMLSLEKSVKDFEPHLALHGGQDGLIFYRSIIEHYTSILNPGGYLCFEFGEGQGDDICQLLTANQYTILERSRDYNQTERALIAQYGRKES